MSEKNPQLPDKNPIIPEGINTSPNHPLKELIQLTLGVVFVFILLAIVVWQGLPFGAKFIPLSWEVRIADSFVESTTELDEQASMLQARLDKILTSMEYKGDTPITMHFIEGDIVNAFATLGGHIFVFEGLMDALKTDVGLDMVLAHEAAHILNRDPIRGAAGALGLQLVFALVTGNGEFAQVSGLMNFGGQMLLLSYSREQEREADEKALDALGLLYDDLTDADELFVYIESMQGEVTFPEFLTSHPNPEERIKAIKDRISR